MSKFATSRPARNLDMSPMLDDAYDATARDAMLDTMVDTMPDTMPDAARDAMLDTARDAMLDTTLPDDARDAILPDDAMLDTARYTTLPDVPLGVEQVLKAQNDLLNELNNNSVRVVTRGGKMTQEPLYPEGHPNRIDQDSKGVNADTPSHPKEKKNDDRNLHASSPNTVTPEEPNDISVSDAETQSGDEHEPGNNMDNDVHNNAQPSNDEDVEIQPTVNTDNPQPKRHDKNGFTARKHGRYTIMPADIYAYWGLAQPQAPVPEPPVEYQTPVYQWEPEELTQQWHPQSAPEYPGAGYFPPWE
ncbi:hypothetical protein ZWY2020_055776 [Hordeum vulgare]|nr:hypothetical protein ZWY2020_055776 [Hordeum vulgare]